MTIAELETISALMDLKGEIKRSISTAEDMKNLALTNDLSLNLEWFKGKLTAYENVLVMVESRIVKIREAAYSRDKKE